MPSLDLDKLKAHRARTFNLSPHKALTSPAQALDFVNARGFTFFWPIKGIDFPSLWTAVAGDRPVPNQHDDPGHVTWGWKDNALDKRIWYYAKVLRRKATMISLEVALYFYALTENYGDTKKITSSHTKRDACHKALSKFTKLSWITGQPTPSTCAAWRA